MSATLRQAAEMLGVSPETTPAEARSLFLQRLQRVDFTPPAAWCAGLSGIDSTVQSGGFRGAREVLELSQRDALQAEVTLFCNDFWRHDPVRRRQIWRDLSERCHDHPVLAMRMHHLLLGLDVEKSSFEALEGSEGQIARLIRKCFPLTPIERAGWQNSWISSLNETPSAWELAARKLRIHAPQIAALDPTLMQKLKDLPQSTPTPAPVHRVARPVAAASTTASSTNQLRFVWLIVIVAIFALRFAFNSSSSSSSKPPVPKFEPNYKIPQLKFDPSQLQVNSFYPTYSGYGRLSTVDRLFLQLGKPYLLITPPSTKPERLPMPRVVTKSGEGP